MVLAQVERFGYTLITVSETETDARKAIMKEYKTAFKAANDGQLPSKDYIARVQDEIYFENVALNQVIWC